MIENNPFDCAGYTILGGLMPDPKCQQCGHYSPCASRRLADSPSECDNYQQFEFDDDDYEYEEN